MIKKLIIFDTPDDFSHPALTRTIQGSNFIMAMVSDTQVKKISSTLDYDMICLEDVDKPVDACVKLKKSEVHEFGLDSKMEKLEKNEEIEKDEAREKENQDLIDCLHEKFIINTETTTQLLMNSFT